MGEPGRVVCQAFTSAAFHSGVRLSRCPTGWGECLWLTYPRQVEVFMVQWSAHCVAVHSSLPVVLSMMMGWIVIIPLCCWCRGR